jgi:protein involved in polysaccharide export with SLBB domain
MNRQFPRWLFTVLFCVPVVSGCTSPGADLPSLPDPPPVADAYVLGAGDKLLIRMFGAGSSVDGVVNAQSGGTDPSGQATVSDSGLVAVPLVGELQASGLTVAQFKQEITAKLAQGYINNPKVGVEVLAYRPFYILGEVNRPGSYPYVVNLTVAGAVSISGGYTYRANEDFAVIERKQNGGVIKGRAEPTTRILPDDIIRISERYF